MPAPQRRRRLDLPGAGGLARFALLPALRSLSGCAGAGVSTSGVYRASRGWGGRHLA
nr:MAG TPA: hypothetical protein [Caudoviricetes sp.]